MTIIAHTVHFTLFVYEKWPLVDIFIFLIVKCGLFVYMPFNGHGHLVN